jgi:hypothetical protein
MSVRRSPCAGRSPGEDRLGRGKGRCGCRQLRPLLAARDPARPAEALLDAPAQRVGRGGLAVRDEHLAGRRLQSAQPRQDLLVVRVGRKSVQVPRRRCCMRAPIGPDAGPGKESLRAPATIWSFCRRGTGQKPIHPWQVPRNGSGLACMRIGLSRIHGQGECGRTLRRTGGSRPCAPPPRAPGDRRAAAPYYVRRSPSSRAGTAARSRPVHSRWQVHSRTSVANAAK